jgi:MarR family transcriptional regulator, organic hydroperoxide resistance regulator
MPLNKNLGFLVTRTARSMKRALEARLLGHSITATQYVVLEALHERDGGSLTLLGRRLYFDNPTITGIVDRMERDGLVERRRFADDRRVINIFLTPKGKELARRTSDIAEVINREAMSKFSPIEETELVRILDTIWQTMNEKAD